MRFTLDRERRVRLAAYDLSGRLVAQLADAVLGPGEQSVLWNGRDLAGRELPSGNYVVVLDAEGQRTTAKLALVR